MVSVRVRGNKACKACGGCPVHAVLCPPAHPCHHTQPSHLCDSILQSGWVLLDALCMCVCPRHAGLPCQVTRIFRRPKRTAASLGQGMLGLRSYVCLKDATGQPSGPAHPTTVAATGQLPEGEPPAAAGLLGRDPGAWPAGRAGCVVQLPALKGHRMLASRLISSGFQPSDLDS